MDGTSDEHEQYARARVTPVVYGGDIFPRKIQKKNNPLVA